MIDDIVVGLLISILSLLAIYLRSVINYENLLRNDFSFMQLMNDKFCCICIVFLVLTNWSLGLPPTVLN